MSPASLTTLPYQYDENLFQATIESVKDGILVVGQNNRILYWNKQFVDMWMIPPDILESKNDKIVLDFLARNIHHAESFVFKALQLYESPEKDFDTISFKDGRIFERFSAPLISSGLIKGRVWSFKDVTEKKRLEAQLIQAQKLEAIGTLAAGIAHDFNNILMVIQGCTSLLLLEEGNSEQCRGRLKEIQNHVRSAADLIQQLLGFAGEGVYSVQAVNLADLIHKAADISRWEKNGIRINETLDENLWPVNADLIQVEQVLLNLLMNARQAMPNGGTITIEAQNMIVDERNKDDLNLDPNRYVKITVIDTGMGMDASTQKRIFEPFFTTHEMRRGAGLGLATAYGIVKSHGGDIKVQSRIGQGSEFSLFLPVEKSPDTDSKEPAPQILKGSETILLIDDEEMVLDVGMAMLTKMGYQVLPAETGTEAIKIYETESPTIDLVIMDMVMPKMGGKEIYDSLRKINPKVKVILSSGYSLNDQASEIMDCGCIDFIQKPFNMTQLSQKVSDALKK